MATNKSVKPGTARWTELVREAIARDGSRNWFLGDAALEIAPMSTNGTNNRAQDNLQQFADEIGVSWESLDNYRKVAAAWSADTRVSGTSWKVHQMLAGRQELIKPGMTVTQAHTALGQRNIGRTGPRSSAQDRARQVVASLGDPEVRAQLLDEPGMDSALERLQADQVHEDAKRHAQQKADAGEPVGWQPRTAAERQQRVEQIESESPTARYFDQAEAATDLSGVLNRTATTAERFTHQIGDCLNRMGKGSSGWDEFAALPDTLTAAQRAVRELNDRLSDVEYYQEHGISRLDAGIQEILRKGE